MAKKVSRARKAPAKRANQYVIHKRLEEPVHNLVSYSVLLALALVILMLVLRLQ
jgi:hypothetical protein